MMAYRVLFLGTTGVKKQQVLERLTVWFRENLGQEWRQIDFEHDYLFKLAKGGLQPNSFLDASLAVQADRWRTSWTRLTAELDGQNTFLSLHGVYIRGHYGSQCALNIDSVVRDFQPNLIVTLIADVYDMWWRTEARAQGEAWRGRPSLEQLISARRQELLVGDQIAHAQQPPVRNLMLAVGHPCETLAHCIIHPDPRIVYLSFPISEPRKMAARGDQSGMTEVSEFIRAAYRHQKTSPHLALECPLAIDEIPFINALPVPAPAAEGDQEQGRQRQAQPEGEIAFDRAAARWDLGRFWPEADRLSLPAAEPQIKFPGTQLRDASGSILTDVTFRDYRMVQQVERLAVFNPVFNNRPEMAGSVGQEIDFAVAQGRPVYVYQDPKHDSQGVMNQFFGRLTDSTMAPAPSRNLIVRKNSVQELLDAVTS